MHEAYRKPMPFWVLLVLCIGVVGAALVYWLSIRTNVSPPAYMKTVAADKEGPSTFLAYFVLADSTGAETTADGIVTVEVTEVTARGRRQLWSDTYRVEKKDFVKATVGRGAFARDGVLCSLVRITFDQFAHEPNARNLGGIEVTFTAEDGTILTGNNTLSFIQ